MCKLNQNNPKAHYYKSCSLNTVCMATMDSIMDSIQWPYNNGPITMAITMALYNGPITMDSIQWPYNYSLTNLNY